MVGVQQLKPLASHDSFAHVLVKAGFSEWADAIGDDEAAGGIQGGQEHAAQPVLAPVQSLVGQQPAAAVLDDAKDPAQPRAMGLADLADRGLDAVAPAEGTVAGTVMACVGVPS